MTSSLFVLDSDHEEFRDSVRAFARKRFLDSYLERALSDEFPHDALRLLADQGLLGLRVPEKLGGQGADLLALGLAVESVAYADINVAYLIFTGNMVAGTLASFADKSVADEWVPRIISGHAIGGTALTEPGSGSDAAALATRAVKVAGGWRLTGEKTSITLASHADIMIVAAKTDSGIGAFIVRMDGPGISSQTFRDPGCRPLGRGSVTLDDVFVPDDHLLGGGAAGFRLLMGEFDLSRSLLGLMATGAAQRAIDAAVVYSRVRTSFGRTLSAYQGVSLPIAEHTTYLEAVRTLGYHALGLREAGLPHTKQAAMLKWWGPLAAFRAIHDAILLHGQVGYSDELPLQSLLRDVSAFQIGDGTAQIQKLIIARETIGREVMPR